MTSRENLGLGAHPAAELEEGNDGTGKGDAT